MAQIKFMSTSLRNWPGVKGRIQTYVHEITSNTVWAYIILLETAGMHVYTAMNMV